MNEIWVGTTLSLSRMRGRREREEKWEEEEVWEGDAGIGGGGGEEGGQVGRGRSSWVSPWWGCCQGDPRDASEAPSRTQREREIQGLRAARRAHPWCVYLPAHMHMPTHPT